MGDNYKPQVVSPKYTNIEFKNSKRECVSVRIEGDEYDVCDKTSKNMWANKKTGQFGRGLINKQSDPRRVERTGKLGEMAFAKVSDREVDTAYREFGDETDFLDGDRKIGLKVAASRPGYESGLIRAVTDRLKKLPLRDDITVFGYVADENRASKQADVVLVGWVTKEQILNEFSQLQPAKIGNHMNYEIPYYGMRPMRELLSGPLHAQVA